MKFPGTVTRTSQGVSISPLALATGHTQHIPHYQLLLLAVRANLAIGFKLLRNGYTINRVIYGYTIGLLLRMGVAFHAAPLFLGRLIIDSEFKLETHFRLDCA